MAKLAYYVHVEDEHGEIHAFGPDTPLPTWAAKKITNPSAWEGGEVPAGVAKAAKASKEPQDSDGGTGDGDGSTSPDGSTGDNDGAAKPYSKWKKDDLQAEVDRRNEGRDDEDLIVVEGKGNVPDLAAALEGDDAAQADSDAQG